MCIFCTQICFMSILCSTFQKTNGQGTTDEKEYPVKDHFNEQIFNVGTRIPEMPEDEKETNCDNTQEGNRQHHSSFSRLNNFRRSSSIADSGQVKIFSGNTESSSSSMALFRRNASEKKKKDQLKRNYGRRVDFHSRYAFPLAYLIFNIFYWSVYMLLP